MKKFKKYVATLQRLNTANTLLLPKKPLMILSGSSNLATAGLTERQIHFLQAMESLGYTPVWSNFPYNRAFEHNGAEQVTFIEASRSNIHYYYQTLFNRAFRKEIVRHLQPLLEKRDAMVVMQSQGLNMWQVFAQACEVPASWKTIALGPVAIHRQSQANLIIKSEHDWYSRILDSRPVTRNITCNHYDYIIDKEVWRNIEQYVQHRPNSTAF